jgi:5'-phosphate synthase pdxT subunit
VAGKKHIGVLAIQGDFARHIAMLETLGVDAVEIRNADELSDLDGLIIPGGESTTMGKMLTWTGMLNAVHNFVNSGKPVYGTCAGVILLAKRIEGGDKSWLNALDITVARNAYGRQVDSFEAPIITPALGDAPVPGVFIRAPVIRALGAGVQVLGSCEGQPVFIREGAILATTFHPELTSDTRVHAYFVSMVE